MAKRNSFTLPEAILNQAPIPALEPVTLQAEPRPLEVDRRRMAAVIIDMQNAFVSKGGMFDLWGVDVSKGQNAIGAIKRVADTAREHGIQIIYIAHQHDSNLYETGGPNSPNWYERSWVTYREHPEHRNALLVSGTWGADIVDELKPQAQDIFIKKLRYSAFFATTLDVVLKTLNMRYLIFMGVATNICVEASIRDAFYLDYWPILVSDASGHLGPAYTQEATIFNVKTCYGYVTDTESVIKVMRGGK